MTRAWYCFESGGVVITVMRWACSTTWKFVTMMPFEAMMKPVPTPRPVWDPNRPDCTAVVTFTTAGRTAWTTWTVGSLLVSEEMALTAAGEAVAI